MGWLTVRPSYIQEHVNAGAWPGYRLVDFALSPPGIST